MLQKKKKKKKKRNKKEEEDKDLINPMHESYFLDYPIRL